jgi:F-type H+-transporting ATPase subunit b
VAESHGEAAKGSGKGTTAHTEAEGGHGFPPFESKTFPSQLVSLLIAFVALYVIVSRLALPKVGGVIDARQKAIDTDLSEAQRLKDESEAAMKAYESELATARARAQAIGAETREKLAAASDAERKALEASLATKLADAETSIAATRTAAMSNVRGIAADAASAIVRQLTGKAPAAKTLDAALNATMKGTA